MKLTKCLNLTQGYQPRLYSLGINLSEKDCTNKYTIHHFTQAAPVRTCRYIKVAKTYLALLCHVRNITSKNTPQKSYTTWLDGIAPFDGRARQPRKMLSYLASNSKKDCLILSL